MRHVHLPLTPAWLYWPEPWVWLLLLLPLVPIVAVLATRRRAHPALRFSGLQDVRAAGRGAARWLLLPTLLRCLALAVLIIAAARPQRADQENRVYVEGIAIQLVIDTSSSMRDPDLSPPGRNFTRLDVVKDVVRRFVKGEGDLPGRPNDLIGMIRFAQFADSTCPLTLNHDAVLQVLAATAITMERSEDGTAIGDGLALAVERLRDLRRNTGSGEQLVITSRIVILLTDGQNNAGVVTPEQAGELAAAHGIKVYTIIAGTGQRTAWGQMQPFDDSQLRRVAEVTGGRHFSAQDREALAGVYREIDKLERSRAEERRFVNWTDLGPAWLWPALGLLLLQTLLENTRLRRIP